MNTVYQQKMSKFNDENSTDFPEFERIEVIEFLFRL
jgi:hypothetical protein